MGSCPGLLVQMGKTKGKRQILLAVENSYSPTARLTGSALENRGSESNQTLVSLSLRNGRHVSPSDKAGLALRLEPCEGPPLCATFIFGVRQGAPIN